MRELSSDLSEVKSNLSTAKAQQNEASIKQSEAQNLFNNTEQYIHQEKQEIITDESGNTLTQTTMEQILNPQWKIVLSALEDANNDLSVANDELNAAEEELQLAEEAEEAEETEEAEDTEEAENEFASKIFDKNGELDADKAQELVESGEMTVNNFIEACGYDLMNEEDQMAINLTRSDTFKYTLEDGTAVSGRTSWDFMGNPPFLQLETPYGDYHIKEGNKKDDIDNHEYKAADSKNKADKPELQNSVNNKFEQSNDKITENEDIKKCSAIYPNGPKGQVNQNEKDGKIDNTEQHATGDCWLLAGINSLNYTEEGREVIKNALEYKDGYTIVHLAVGDYSVTDEELALITGQTEDFQYSTGDVDMNILELAIEKVRDDIANGKIKIPSDIPKYLGPETGIGESSTWGGYTSEIWYYMTGKLSELAEDKDLIKQQLKDFQENNNKDKVLSSSISTIGKNKLENEKLGLTVIESKSEEGVNRYFIKDINGDEHKIGCPHAYSVKSCTDDTVTVINPWDADDEIILTQEQYLALFDNSSICDLSDKNPVNNNTKYIVQNNNGMAEYCSNKETVFNSDGSIKVVRYSDDNDKTKFVEYYNEKGEVSSRTDFLGNNGGIYYEFDENGNVINRSFCTSVDYWGNPKSWQYPDENFYQRIYSTNIMDCKNLSAEDAYKICRMKKDSEFELARKYLYLHPDADLSEVMENMNIYKYKTTNLVGENIEYAEYEIEQHAEGTYSIICKDENGNILSEEIRDMHGNKISKADYGKNGAYLQLFYDENGKSHNYYEFHYEENSWFIYTNEKVSKLYERKMFEYPQFSGMEVHNLLKCSDEQWALIEEFLENNPNATYQDIKDNGLLK